MLFSFRSWYVLLCFFTYEVISNNNDELGTNPANPGDSIKIPCAVRKDISPCTCDYHTTTQDRRRPWINVACQKMHSFSQIISVLQNKFDNHSEIHLVIEYSNLEDMKKNKFSDIRSSIGWIFLRHNVMTELPNSTFDGTNTVTHLVLENSKINQFPGSIFDHLPNVQFLSIGRTSIKTVTPSDFKSLRKLKNLVIHESDLSVIENGTFPDTLTSIILEDNNITTLNHTLRNNFNLKLIIARNNNIASLKEQLPDYTVNTNLAWLDVSLNKLLTLPDSFKNLTRLNIFNGANNRISILNNVFRKLNRMSDLDMSNNQINKLSSQEFENCASMRKLNLSDNEIWNLNRSLVSLVSLEFLNLTNNKLTEFSLEEIRGLRKLQIVELCHNKIEKFVGKLDTDTAPLNISIEELRLEFNDLRILEGSIGEIEGLQRLNISYNYLETIPAYFLNNLTKLQILDVSHNLLHTLDDTSKARLPSLGYFYASNNRITELNKIFSVVCFMHLQNNAIETVKPDFIEDNRCIYEPGVNATLYVFLDGNPVLCKETDKQMIASVEKRNATKIVGQCPKAPNEELKYHVNNTDSSPITLVTLGEYV